MNGFSDFAVGVTAAEIVKGHRQSNKVHKRMVLLVMRIICTRLPMTPRDLSSRLLRKN